MKHFLQVATMDPIPSLTVLLDNPDLWNENPLRTKHPGTAHAEVDDIWMLFNRIPANPAEIVDDTQVFPYRAWQLLASLRLNALDLMRRVEGIALGRMIVTRLAPGKRIYPHVDQGAPAEFYRRYQIVLQSRPGCNFRIGDETVHMPGGTVWWINNRVEHEVTNNSADDRIACIVDIRPC